MAIQKDKKIWDLIKLEKQRQQETIELIASENFVSQEVLDVTGTILTNKYAEGYPNARYYNGCNYIDQVEQLAIDRLKIIFNAKFANVQPHSGSQANTAALAALIKPGDKILGMSLDCGGHLTHGHKVNFSGKIYDSYFYSVDKQTEVLNMEEVRKKALKVKPKLIIAGASAYSRFIDWKVFRQIADEVGAFLLVDMAHIAGQIAAKLHDSPLKYAHVVTSTTHKTLRGPRGGIILTNDKDISIKVDKAVFPGTQGGPLMHVIGAKAVAFEEASKPEYKKYIKDVLDNSKTMVAEFKKRNVRVVANGTDNHLFLLDIKKSYQISGHDAANALNKIGIIVNKNTIPFDQESPMVTSGIRIGTPAMTTHGFNKKDFIEVVDIIDTLLKDINNGDIINNSIKRVKILLKI